MKDDVSQCVRTRRPIGSWVRCLTLAAWVSFFAATGLPGTLALAAPITAATACAVFCDALNSVFDPHFAIVSRDFSGSTFLAEAAASFGSVGVEDTVHIDGFVSAGPQNFDQSASSFNDTLTIAGAGTGRVSFSVGLHGSARTTLPGIVDPNLQFTFNAGTIRAGLFAGGTQIHVASVLDGFPSGTLTSTSFVYTFGDPIFISMDMTGALGATIANPAGGPLIAELLYVDTAILNGITVLDANGVPVTAFNVTSDSGTFYDNNGVGVAPTNSVPEPSTWLLLGSGLAGFVIWRRRYANA